MRGADLSARPAARATGRTQSTYRAAVVKILARLKHGSLRLTLPDGEVMIIGEDREPCVSMHIHRDDMFRQTVLYGDVGFGESYVNGDWDTDDLAALLSWFLLNIDDVPTISGSAVLRHATNVLGFVNRWSHILRANTMAGSKKNIVEHYDLSNEFFATFLDSSMTYSSALFTQPSCTLEKAQEEKFDRLCRILQLSSSDHVLEIGSGWGGFARYAARSYGCRVTGITISDEQLAYAQEAVRHDGLDHLVDFRHQDYRTLTGKYDKIVSIEMLEAVGDRFIDRFFQICDSVLAKDGLLGLQVIVCPDSRYDRLRKGVDWIQKHIFPGSLLPSIARINHAINRAGSMYLFDLKEFGTHYAKTLKTWKQNFNRDLDRIRLLGCDDRFIRKWNYYLSYCEAAFAMRNITVVQMLYTRPNNLALHKKPV